MSGLRSNMGAMARMGRQAVGRTAEEVLQNAGLDYTVEMDNIYTKEGKQIRNKFMRTYRSDNDMTLGTVTAKYKPCQNIDVMRLGSSLVENDELEWDRVGSTHHGEKFMASFKLPDSFKIDGWDSIDQYMYMINSHDGSTGVRFLPANMRIFCSNQFSALNNSLKRAGINPNELVVRHSHIMDGQLDKVRAVLGKIDKVNEHFADTAENLLEVQMDEVERVQYYIETLGLAGKKKLVNKKKRSKDYNPFGLTTRGQNTLSKVIAIEQMATNTHGNMADSAWQAFNTVTEYIDHQWTYNADGKSNAKRVESAIMGTGQRTKNKAWDSVVARLVA